MSALKTSRPPRQIADFGARAKDAAAQGVHDAREWAAPRLEDAADAVTRARDAAAQGVHDAREWAAPRLEDAADAVTASVAPRVSAALRSTARQVKPEVTKSGKTGLRRLLSWRWLLGAGVAIAAAGASAAFAMRRRYASATAEVREAADPPSGESAPEHQTDTDDTAVVAEANGSHRAGKSRR
ncbi:MAG TPA: hypothetical protein VME19_17820 [Streptosporangiaceae bacterium]|nr:hypothetical protein [Streptosporangiaceae bacterium]